MVIRVRYFTTNFTNHTNVACVINSCDSCDSWSVFHHKFRRTRQTLWGGSADANPKLLPNDT